MLNPEERSLHELGIIRHSAVLAGFADARSRPSRDDARPQRGRATCAVREGLAEEF